MEDITFSSDIPMLPEFAPQFSLRLKDPYSNIEIIVCKEMELEIEAVPASDKGGQVGDMTLVMQWEKDRMHFNVLGDATDKGWTIELFQTAIHWYVVKHLDRYPTTLQLTDYIRNTFWWDFEDGYEENEPESEEDREFRLHISDEKRKFDTVKRVANSAGIKTWPDDDPLPF